jgi:LuxR family maltose regulon positive regulatory protein
LSFIQSFTGSHRFVLDYLVQEVLEQQPESVQTFLLHTSILDRLTGPLCDALLLGDGKQPSSAAMLEMLDRANLFIIPLDDERRWYRYHHLFADLLRRRLRQSSAPSAFSLSSSPTGETEGRTVAELHRRASVWYEENGLEIKAFQHAAAANDVERAARLMEGEGMPLHYRGAMVPVMNWLASLPTTTLDARPALWVTYASALTMAGQPINGVEDKLLAAEAALVVSAADGRTRDLVGQIAAIRAMLAIPQDQAERVLAQSRRALEYLHPDNLPVRTGATWTLGFAYQSIGDRAAASRAFSEAISISQASGNTMITLAALTSLGQIQESENQLHLAAESYRRGQELAGDPPLPGAAEIYLGLARVYYQWNDLDACQQHAQQALQLARQLQTVATPAHCQVLLARLELARGDAAGASAILAEAEQFVRQHNFTHHLSAVADLHVRALLHQGALEKASELAEQHPRILSRARVRLAQGDASSALAALEPLREQAEAKGWESERLEVMVLQAVALYERARGAHSTIDKAVYLLGEALALAEPGDLIRIFIDQGSSMARLLNAALTRGISPVYTGKLLAAFPAAQAPPATGTEILESEILEPLSERELQVLQLIAEGLTNPEIADRLFLALNTVKVHTRNIYGKLGVHSRTQAIVRARALGVLPST